MAVKIYSSVDSLSALSTDGELTNPFSISFDGRVGGYKEAKLYIRNSDSLYYYTSLSLTLDDDTDLNITNDLSKGFSWKLFSGDLKPTFNDWANTPAANTITFSDIGSLGSPDTSTYLPFWVYLQVPAGLSVQVFTEVKFLLSGNEVIA
jgi:hypothetical protein